MNKLESLLRTGSARSAVWINDDTIAFIRVGDGGPRVWEKNIVTGEERQRTFGNERIWNIKAHNSTGSILFCMDKGGNEHEQIYLLEPNAAEPKDLTGLPNTRHFLGGLAPDGRTLSYACNSRTPETFDIWTCNLLTGEKKMVLQNSDHYNWPAGDALSPNGQYMLYNKLLGTSNNALWMVDLLSGEAVRVPADEVVSAETNPAWKADSTGFFLVSDRDAEFPYVCYYDIASATMEKCFAFDWEVESLGVSSDDRYLAMTVNEDGYYALKIWDLTEKAWVNAPQPPKGTISAYGSVNWSPSGHKLLFTVNSGKRPEGIWLLDLDKDSIQAVVRPSMPGLTPDDLVEPTLHHFRSFDGLEVPFWLYTPKGQESKNMPVVVEIHGGPEGQELPTFDPFIQYLVSEGIAVAAPNVRGSTGYGKTYTHLDDVEKRLDSVADIDYLVRHLVGEGIADKSRLAVTGMSYGGFMTLSCATRLPDLWCCAIDSVGMYNLESFLENTAEYRRAHRETEYGSLAHHREILRAVSPIAKIDDIQAPLMVIQGRNDPRVPAEEAEQVVGTLQQRGHTVEYICYEDEGHGVTKLVNQLDCYPRMAAFLKKYMNL